MKLRKLARLCEHDRMKAHWWPPEHKSTYPNCPGGVFLPDDTLVIEKVDVDDPECGDCDHLPRREWPEWAQLAIFRPLADELLNKGFARKMSTLILDALSVREAEPDPNQLEVPFTNRSGLW